MFKAAHLGGLNKWQSFSSWLLLIARGHLCEIRDQHQGQRRVPSGPALQQVREDRKSQIMRNKKQALCKDLTTDVLCKLRDKSQHSHQGEDRERLKEGGGGDSVSSFQQVKGRRGCL